MGSSDFRFEQIGSLTRPESVLSAREDFKAGKLRLEDLRKVEDTAILEALEMQRKVGVDVYTDGEYRQDAWQTNFSEAVSGFEDSYPVREVTNPDGSVSLLELHTKAIVGKLKQNRRIVDVDSAFMKQHSPGPVKITMPAASMIYRGAFRAGATEAAYETPKELLFEVARIIRDEMKALVAEGVTYIQLDEGFTNLATEAAIALMREQGVDPEKQIEEQIEAENSCYDAVRGEGVTLGAHLCRGSRTAAVKSLSNPVRTTRDFEFLAEHVFNQLNADRFLFEWDSGFEALRFLPKGKVAVLGLVTSLYPTLESQDDLLRCFEEASRYCSIDQLAISTQCGFQGSGTRDGAHMTIDEQQRKLELIADIVRRVWG
jgi:5-methyltetrahydropteroyltriglutamate--homocysteine methyltransferase